MSTKLGDGTNFVAKKKSTTHEMGDLAPKDH